jgi:SpoIID/LytB domain protein
VDSEVRHGVGCWSLVAGCFFGAFLLLVSPAPAQTINIRLFGIFHPQSVEISSGEERLANGLMKKRKSANNFLVVSPTPDTLSWMRVTLVPPILQLHSARFIRSLSLADTINITAAASCFFATVLKRREAEKSGAELLPRRYSGAVRIYVAGNELGVVNSAPVDDYLAAVLAAEMPNAAPAALQAQAVVARTYMIKNLERHQENGYQFCDLTHCQVYKGNASVTESIRQAVAGTEGEILTFAHQPIEAFYNSTCGGFTADDAGVWANQKDQPYLKNLADAANQIDFCADSPHYRWRMKIAADSLYQIWQRRLGEPIRSIAIVKKGADGRVRELALMGSSLHLISGEDFRAVTCRVLGWNTLKSTAVDLRFEKNTYLLAGRGLGHGLGLCQYGAMEMARRGYSHREILRHYFPGTEIERHFKNRED